MRQAMLALAMCVAACSSPGNGGGDLGPADAGALPPSPAADAGPVAADDGGTLAPIDAGTAADAGTAVDGGTVGTADAGTPADGGTALAGCDGIVPGALGNSVTVQVPSGAGDQCVEATADESGNVAAALRRASGVGNLFDWHIFSPSGEHQGVAPEIIGDVFPQGDGFEAIKFFDLGPASSPFFIRIAPDGDISKKQLVGSDDTGARSFRAWPDGLVVLTDHCMLPPGTTTLRRFAGDGTLIATASIDNPPPMGCDVAGLANGPGGVTLIVFHTNAGVAGDQYAARWYDAKGAPMTGFFSLGAAAGDLTLRALVDGNVAVQASGHWLGLVSQGATAMTPPPSWLADGHDLSIVRGERAYALIPESGAALNHLDLVSTSGNICGSITFPGAGALRTGADGTVIAASGDGGCTKTFWPRLLE